MANGESVTPLWEVTSQQETVDLAPSGQYVTGTRVAFRTRSGAQGSIFVPQAEYQAGRVKSLLDVRAAEMEAVHNMRGEG